MLTSVTLSKGQSVMMFLKLLKGRYRMKSVRMSLWRIALISQQPSVRMSHVELAMMSLSKYVEMYQSNSAPMFRDSLVETLLPNPVLILLTMCAKMSLEKNANQSRRPNVRMFHERFVSRLRENIASLFQGKRLPHASRTTVAQFKINHAVKCPDKRVNRSLNK